ncbi:MULTISPECIES: hypothetical protein [unclassified Leptolyngbya]|uniref:hypothetical protein n=1 Tax=unclassified Leptolyngbya TaxID=2650499 RepID=UPI0016831F92|nr:MULTISPECIES: hypothetical protein [unclassified Leptolyngbya]MBD1910878.1 hypothetical protein [Leptolyngbya sp. FACHB-8]MBD2153727.1 hypothetical protein [Leptolyngbya sp. FACHB-16]
MVAPDSALEVNAVLTPLFLIGGVLTVVSICSLTFWASQEAGYGYSVAPSLQACEPTSSDTPASPPDTSEADPS